jgi:hypothetical protein
MSRSARIALIGEARGEFLFLRRMAEGIRQQLGENAVLEVAMEALDLTPEERRTCLVPHEEPEFAEALAIPTEHLVDRVREAETDFGIPNLRPLWRSDLLSWRDGVPDDLLARQAIGYLRVFDRVFADHPELVGGFAEDGGRLIKRCFRSMSLKHGGRMVIALPVGIPNRIAFVEQEDYTMGLPPYESFEATGRLRAEAHAHADRVVNSVVEFSRPRDLSLSRRRMRNFLRLAYRQLTGAGPARDAYLAAFARDYGYQRAQLALLNRFADRELPSRPTVFYPVQVVQDTQMSIRGAPYLDQRWLIRYLAHSLPYGCQLVVKPHPAAPGELSAAGLLRMRRDAPNLRILHPSVHAHEVLRGVSAMVTVNSTTGFEALMFGIPVVTLGGSMYRHCGVTYDVHDPAELPAAVAAALNGPAPDRGGVLKLIAYCLAVSHEAIQSYADPSRSNAFRFAEALMSEFALSEQKSRLTLFR